MKFDSKKSNLKWRIYLRGKKTKKKRSEWQTKIEVKQRSGDTDITDKIKAERITKYYGAGEKDEESELEKRNFKKLAISSEKENKIIGTNTKGINSELDKKSDKLKPIEKRKKQKFGK